MTEEITHDAAFPSHREKRSGDQNIEERRAACSFT